MKILIVGYGRMGREVEKALLERGHTAAGRVDPQAGDADYSELTEEALSGADAAIEFSLPGGLEKNLQLYGRTGTPAVLGTTGWDDRREAYRKQIEEAGGSVLWGSNFSLGAHIFWKLTARAAALVRDIESYDLMIHEFHHRYKKDSPSGTALTTAEKVLENCPRKTEAVTQRLDRPIRDSELHVSSTRGGSIPGTHQLLLDSQADTIEVRHTARSRQGFAAGAVMAAEWLQNRRGFFRIEDFIEDILP